MKHLPESAGGFLLLSWNREGFGHLCVESPPISGKILYLTQTFALRWLPSHFLEPSLSQQSRPSLRIFLVALSIACVTMPLVAVSATYISIQDPVGGTLAPGPQQPYGYSDYPPGQLHLLTVA